MILTLFTVMLDYTDDQTMYDNTLWMHSLLKPAVQPMLFVPSAAQDATLVKEACKLGWQVLTVPQCDV